MMEAFKPVFVMIMVGLLAWLLYHLIVSDQRRKHEEERFKQRADALHQERKEARERERKP